MEDRKRLYSKFDNLSKQSSEKAISRNIQFATKLMFIASPERLKTKMLLNNLVIV